MTDWQLIGPRIPSPVWRPHLLRASLRGQHRSAWDWVRLGDSSAHWQGLDVSHLRDGARVLLLIHGTAMRSRPGFGGLSELDLRRLFARYGDRILAFEHRGFANPLADNVRDLCKILERANVTLRADVIGLSRGGLIARHFAEGWSHAYPGGHRLQVERLIFVATPNDGTPSARRDPAQPGAGLLRAWRSDVRRMALLNRDDRTIECLSDPYSVAPFETEQIFQYWPLLHGSRELVPGSPAIRKLNGFLHAPVATTEQRPRYFAIASVFDFQHGAPDEHIRIGNTRAKRSEISRFSLPAAGDLVVPAASVYLPRQGPFSAGLFPIPKERLMVLAPSSNATHMGLLRIRAVREQICNWLDEKD